MPNFEEWIENRDDLPKLNEDTSRYSIEVNYRTTVEEMQDGFAKLVLGYVSAGMKNCGYHAKILFTDKPYRVFVSTRNWDDGEWVGLAVWDKDGFIIGAGHYNKELKSVSIQRHRRTEAKSAAEICKELRNYMESLKKEKPRQSNSLEPAKLKRGPKPMHMKKLNKIPKTYKAL